MDFNLSLIHFSKGPNFASIQKNRGRAGALYILLLKISGPMLVSKCCLEFPIIEQMLLSFVEYF
jgi:hypothetical protein